MNTEVARIQKRSPLHENSRETALPSVSTHWAWRMISPSSVNFTALLSKLTCGHRQHFSMVFHLIFDESYFLSYATGQSLSGAVQLPLSSPSVEAALSAPIANRSV